MNARADAPIEAPVLDLVLAVGEAMDLMDPALGSHHLRVATVATALGRRVGLPAGRLRDLAIAAALHDAGAFSLEERIDTLSFELRDPSHAEAGWRILRGFGAFARASRIVRHHHLAWDGGRGERSGGDAVPMEAHLLHLADRATVTIRDPAAAVAQGRAGLARIRRLAGKRFVPELVEALEDASASERFWLDAASGNPGVVAEAVPGDSTLGPGEIVGLARLLCHLVDFRSRFTATHSCGVAAVARHVAGLCGLHEETAAQIGIAAALHDVGKLGIPGELLDRERPLDERARQLLRAHPYHGWRVLGRVGGLERVNAWASYHHERLDGSGYPFGLAGAQIPIGSRIVAVADVFTALTEERPYRRGMSAREATGVLLGMAAKGELDAAVVGEVLRHRDDANALRRAAQESAAGRYLECRVRAGGQSAPSAVPAA